VQREQHHTFLGRPGYTVQGALILSESRNSLRLGVTAAYAPSDLGSSSGVAALRMSQAISVSLQTDDISWVMLSFELVV
jgi:hypothetical protein